MQLTNFLVRSYSGGKRKSKQTPKSPGACWLSRGTLILKYVLVYICIYWYKVHEDCQFKNKSSHLATNVSHHGQSNIACMLKSWDFQRLGSVSPSCNQRKAANKREAFDSLILFADITACFKDSTYKLVLS